MFLKWFLVSYLSTGVLLTIANVGKPRKPTTPAVATVATVISGLIIGAIFIWWPQ